MKCSKCSAEIRVGSVYCEKCGEPAQIVSDYNILEDDFLVTILDENKKEEEIRRIQEEKEKKKVAKKPKINKNFKIWIGIGGAFLVALLLFILVFSTSYGHYVNRGLALDKKEKYAEAITYYEKAIRKDATKAKAQVLAADDYLLLKDYENAEKLYLSALKVEKHNLQAYQGLISLYLALGDYEALNDLRAGVKNRNVLKLFEDNLVVPPTFSEISGKFSDDVILELTSRDGLEIYYSDDGSDPTKGDNGKLYHDSITIAEGKTTIKAACKNEDGNFSPVITHKYQITYKDPEAPQVEQESGSYHQPTAITITVPEGGVVYYTWDGTTPTRESARYTGPIDMMEGNNILSVILIDKHGRTSDVVQYNYKYIPQ